MGSKLACLCSLLVLYLGFLLKSSFAQYHHGSNSCSTPDGEVSKCIDVWQCQLIINILKAQTLSPAVSKKLSGYKCAGRNKVCCPSKPIVLEQQILYHTREEPPDVTNHKNFHLLPEECGTLDSSIRITHGEDAYLNEFPWMALLQYQTSHGLRFLCGGTIINDNYILTAAHCLEVKGAELVSVRVGEYSITNETDCEVQNDRRGTLKCNPPVQDLRVEKIISHPQFIVKDKKNIINDIALLRVSRMEQAENVSPVCLPVGEVRDWPLRYVFVAGWGLTDSQTMEKADVLQKVGLPIQDKKTCAATYSESGIELANTQICAGGVEKKATCSGDSGGPVLVAALAESDFMYVQYGVVSAGPSYCGISGYPGIYTLVKFYMDWILDNMEP